MTPERDSSSNLLSRNKRGQMISRLRFYISKAGFLIAFIWWREWELARDEWNITYEELQEAEARLPEIEREIIERLLDSGDFVSSEEARSKLGL